MRALASRCYPLVLRPTSSLTSHLGLPIPETCVKYPTAVGSQGLGLNQICQVMPEYFLLVWTFLENDSYLGDTVRRAICKPLISIPFMKANGLPWSAHQVEARKGDPAGLFPVVYLQASLTH